HNMSARLLKAIIFRKQSMRVEALRVLEKILEVDPLNHAARYEMYRLKRNPSALRAFQRMIRNEFPEETHLEISLFYVRLGLFKEAKELLGLVPEYPTACYWLAYLLRERDPQASQAWLDKARGLSPWLVFPFREESIPVLEWASLAAPEDWKPKYFLALILWSRGRVSEARDLLEACGNPEYGPFYLTRGHFYRTMDLSRARRDFERAVAIDPHSWRSWHTLIRFLNDQSLFPEALENARKAFQDWPEHVALRIDFIRALMGNGKYKEAADILESTVVLPYEGATGVHNLFVLCHVHLALEEMSRGAWEEASLHLKKAKTYPEHLGTGRPYEPDQRMQDFLLALCCDNLGNKEQADKLRENILAYTAEHGVRQNLHDYFAGWLLLQEGEERKARELMRRAKPPRDLLQKIRSILRSHR
ncbi:MAG: tetratricopeptide repeat protein, partial [Candidatus Aminicenantales bacterium]